MAEGKDNSIDPALSLVIETLEIKLKASEEIICSKIDILQSRVEETKRTIDFHVNWHDCIKESIVKTVVKYGVAMFVGIVVVVAYLGFKDGILSAAIVKAVTG